MAAARSETVGACELTWLHERLSLTGTLDLTNAAAVAGLVRGAIDDGVEVLDLTGISLFSAAGVRVLVSAGSHARLGGRVVRAEGSPIVLHVLRVCGHAEIRGLRIDEPAAGQGAEQT